MHQYLNKKLKLLVWKQKKKEVSPNKLLTEVDKGEMEDWEMLCYLAKLKELKT